MDRDAPLYEARRKIYPQRVSGTFRRDQMGGLFVTLGIYYFTPFLRWDRGPNAPDQAVLIDLPNSPLLFLLYRDPAAGGLLPHRPADHRRDDAVPDERAHGPRLVRLLCPQTVWTDLSRPSSAGARATGASICRDRGGWTLERVAAPGRKHSSGSWSPGRPAARGFSISRRPDAGARPCDACARRSSPILDRHPDFTTYVLAGHMREQVSSTCVRGRASRLRSPTSMRSTSLSLRSRRAAGSVKKYDRAARQGLPSGDCVDCLQCVHVCPTGIDIREGPISVASNADCASTPAMP